MCKPEVPGIAMCDRASDSKIYISYLIGQRVLYIDVHIMYKARGSADMLYVIGRQTRKHIYVNVHTSLQVRNVTIPFGKP